MMAELAPLWGKFYNLSGKARQWNCPGLLLRPFHIHTETEPKPNRNRTEKLQCLKPYGRFHICAETETEPKPNAEPKTCTILILFFSVSVAEFQQTRQVILIKSAHTQPRALYS